MIDPFNFPEEWGSVLLSGTDMPGIIVSVDGCERPYEWQVQKAQGTKGATAIYKGEGLAEGIKVVTQLVSPEHFLDVERFRTYVAPEKGKKAPRLTVVNPIFNFNKIESVSIKHIGSLTPAGKGRYNVEWTFIEQNETKSTQTGTAGPSQWMQSKSKSPQDAADAEIEQLIKKAQSA